MGSTAIRLHGHPTERWIAYVCRREETRSSSSCVQTAGGERVVVRQGSRRQTIRRGPTTRATFAFSSRRGGVRAIYVVDLYSGLERRLSLDIRRRSRPAWFERVGVKSRHPGVLVAGTLEEVTIHVEDEGAPCCAPSAAAGLLAGCSKKTMDNATTDNAAQPAPTEPAPTPPQPPPPEPAPMSETIELQECVLRLRQRRSAQRRAARR